MISVKIRFISLGRVFGLFLAMSDVYFYFFPRNLKSFTLLDTDQNRSNSVISLVFRADLMCMSEDDLESKFSDGPIWVRGF